MKRRCLILAALLFSLQITGCGIVNLTNQENSVIAEYIALILLKHDKNYEPTLSYEAEIEPEELEEKEKDKQSETEPEPEEQQTEPKETENNEKPEPQETGDSNAAISDVFKKGISLKAIDVSFYQSYPKNKRGVLPVEAGKGNTICVVSLKVANKDSSAVKCNFMENERSYELQVNGKTTYHAVQSLLVNDIQYLDETIKPGKSIQAVITFEIPKSAKNKSMELFVSKGSKTISMKVK